MQQHQRALWKRKRPGSITESVNRIVLSRSLLTRAPNTEKCQLLLALVHLLASVPSQIACKSTLAELSNANCVHHTSDRAGAQASASSSSTPLLLLPSSKDVVDSATDVPDSLATTSALLNESALLSEHGFPGVHRVESAFAAAACHSEMGAMLQYFARSVVELFARGLHSGVHFCEEYERRLQDSLNKGSNSVLQPYLYELQGFSTLFSFLWSQLVMLEADVRRLSTSAVAASPNARTTAAVPSCSSVLSMGTSDIPARAGQPSQQPQPPDASSARGHVNCVSKATQTTDTCAHHTMHVATRAATTLVHDGDAPTNHISSNEPKQHYSAHHTHSRTRARAFGEGDCIACVGVGDIHNGSVMDGESERSGLCERVDGTHEGAAHQLRSSVTQSHITVDTAHNSSHKGVSVTESCVVRSKHVNDAPVRHGLARRVTLPEGATGNGDGSNRYVPCTSRGLYDAHKRGQQMQRGLPSQSPSLVSQQQQWKQTEFANKNNTTHSSDNLLPVLVINDRTSVPGPARSRGMTTVSSPRSRLHRHKSKNLTHSALSRRDLVCRPLSPPLPRESSDFDIDTMMRKEQMRQLKRKLGTQHIRDFASERDTADYLRQLAELAQQF